MITRRLRAALAAGVAASRSRPPRSRPRAMDRLRSDQFLAERPDRGARAAAGQQRDPEPGEPGQHADQPGQEPGEPALFVAGPARAVDHPDRAAAHPGAAHRLQRHDHQSGVHADLSAEPIPARPPSQQLLAGAQTRWQNSLAGFQDAMRVQAGVVQNLDSTRTQINALIIVEPVGLRRASGRPVRQPARRAPDQAACRPHRRHGGDRARPEPGRRAQCREPGAGAAADSPTSSITARATSPAPRRCSTDARAAPSISPRSAAPPGSSWSPRRSSRPPFSFHRDDGRARRASASSSAIRSDPLAARTGALPGDRHGRAE